MVKFDCTVMYKKVEGDSYTSTYNKLLAHKFIDKYLNLKIDVASWRSLRSELNSQGEAILGYKVNLFNEKKLLQGIRITPNMQLFGLIDFAKKRTKLGVQDSLKNNSYLRSQIEGDNSTPNIVQKEIRNLLGIKINEKRRGENNKVERRNTKTLTDNLSEGMQPLFGTYINDVKLQLPKIDTNNETENSENYIINQLYIKSMGDNRKLIGRTFNEIFSGEEFDIMERRTYVTFRILRSFKENKLNSGISESLGIPNVFIAITHPDLSPFFSETDGLVLDPIKIEEYFSELYTYGVNLDEYTDVVVFEELIHQVADRIINDENLEKAINESIKIRTANRIQEIYPTEQESNAYQEALRMKIQQEMLGYTTENLIQPATRIPNSLFRSIWDWLLRIFEQGEYTKEHIQNVRDYINNKYTGIYFSKDFYTGDPIQQIYNTLGQKNNSFIKTENVEQVEKMINEYNESKSGRKLSIYQVGINLDNHMLKTEYTSTYLMKNTDSPIEEIEEIDYPPHDSTTNFNLKCI